MLPRGQASANNARPVYNQRAKQPPASTAPVAVFFGSGDPSGVNPGTPATTVYFNTDTGTPFFLSPDSPPVTIRGYPVWAL